MKLSNREKRGVREYLMKMEEQDFLSNKLEERAINKFVSTIFKKLLKNQD